MICFQLSSLKVCQSMSKSALLRQFRSRIWWLAPNFWCRVSLILLFIEYRPSLEQFLRRYMMSRYIPDWMSQELFIDWIDATSILRHSSNSIPEEITDFLREVWEWAESVSCLGVGVSFESSVTAVAWGWRRSLVLFDLTKLMMSYFEVIPALSSPALTSSMFYLSTALSLALRSATWLSSSCRFISSSAILASISSIFSLSFLLKSLKRSSWTVISLPASILAQACSSSAIFRTQLARSLCTFSVMRFMGMQLYLSTRPCFHFAQSSLLSKAFTQRRNLPALQSPSCSSVQKAGADGLVFG